MYLVAAANISKILSPASACGSNIPQEIDIQRKEIRKLLDITDSSPLRLRKFRNYFEPYDFELGKWIKSSKDKMLFDSNIVDFDPSGVPSDKLFPIRNFNPTEFKLYFRNKEYDILATVNVINKLSQKIQQYS